ncbi:hypothetical protein [Haemophilus haemolyticus]|uniref:hypothetical protein n=1 Tax=Haemophilus haemolyticus TaxID=726 RepID=UPI0018645031|nr:hypothetical protein [Haemophilus haemolyticus]
MKFKFLGVFKRVLNWFQKPQKVTQYRPHFYSKNAWSYVVRGKMTPAVALMLRLTA